MRNLEMVRFLGPCLFALGCHAAEAAPVRLAWMAPGWMAPGVALAPGYSGRALAQGALLRALAKDGPQAPAAFPSGGVLAGPEPGTTQVNAEGLPAMPFEEPLENPAVIAKVSARPWWSARHDKVCGMVAARRFDLLLVGDSITHQWGGMPGSLASEGCEPHGQAAWDRHFAHRNTLNLGFSGDRTQNVLWRLEHGELEGQRPKAAVVMIGTNNSSGPVCTPEQTAEGIRALCRTLRQRCPGVRILLVGLLPRFHGDPAYDAFPGLVNASLAPLAVQEGVTWLDLTSVFAEPEVRLRPGLFYDGLHLSEAGYRVWGEALEPHLKRIMGEE